MRQHAHPMRRPTRWPRVAAAVVVLAVLLVAVGLVAKVPTSTSPGSLTAGPNQAAALELTASPPAPSAAPSPSPSAGATIDAAAARPGFRPAHVAIDAWPRPTPPPIWSLTGYVWPIAHPRLTLPFGPTLWGSRVVDGQLFHDGVDLATFCNDRIMAAHDGVVLAAGRQFDDYLGWVGSLAAYYARLNQRHLWFDLPIVVVVDDGNGYRSVYAHMWKLTVVAGQHVKAGQLIGYEGMTGHATGCHLHYSLFSPLETAVFGIEPKVATDMRLPRWEIARVDPLLVLPYRKGISSPARNLGS